MRCKEVFCFTICEPSNITIFHQQSPEPKKRKQMRKPTAKGTQGRGVETTPVLMCDTDRRYALDRQSACVGAKGGLGIAQVLGLMKMGWMDGRRDVVVMRRKSRLSMRD